MNQPGRVCIRRCRCSIAYKINGVPYQIDFNSVNEVKITLQPIITGRDSFGCSIIAGYDVKGEFNSLPSDNEAYQEYVNMSIRARDDIKTSLTIIDKAGNDIWFSSVKPITSGDLSGDGKENKSKITWDCILSVDEAAPLFPIQ
jgi:hypothetical protein